MTIVNERSATQRAARMLAPSAPTSLMQNFASSARATLFSETTIAESLSMERAYDSYIGEIAERTGTRLDNPISETVPAFVTFGASEDARNLIRQRRRDRFAAATARLAEANPGAFELRSPERLREDAFAIVHGEVEANQRVAAGARTAGAIGQFAGAAFGTIADPPVLATMFAGAPAAAGILRTAMIEAGLAGATEAVIQPSIQRFRAEAGLPSGVAEAFKNIGLATAGGGIFAGFIRGAVGGARALSGGLRDIRVRNAQEQAAARYLERQAALQEQTPFGPAGQAEHVARTSQAQRDLAEGTASRNAEEPQSTSRPVESEAGVLRQAQDEGIGFASGAAGAGADLRSRALAETVDVDRLRANRETARELDALPDLDAMLDTARRGVPRPKGLRSLIDVLRAAGGIRDQGGELRHIGITGRTRPGLVNNRSGMTLDDAGLLAFESGFFGPNRAGFGERPTTSDLVDRLRDDFEGRRVFTDDDQAVLDDFDQVQAGVEAFRRKFDDLGLDIGRLNNDQLRGALRAIRDEPSTGSGRGAATASQDAAPAARAAAEATDAADTVDDVLEVAVRAAYGERLDAEIWMGEGDEIVRRRAGDVLDGITEEDAHIKEWFACLEGAVETGVSP